MAKKNKLAIGEGNEFKLCFDKPEITGNEAFIPIMNDYNSGDSIRMARAREAACQQMERVIVKMISQKFPSYAKPFGGELKQAAFVGVLTGLAVERSKRYDPYSKYTPSAFFYKYIMHELVEFVNTIGPAKKSSHYNSSLSHVKKAIDIYVKKGEPYDETTIAQYTNISLDTVKVCFDILCAEEGVISYNDLVDNEDNRDNVFGINSETPDKIVEKEERSLDIVNALETLLTENERYIILNRFGFIGEIKTCNAIAQDLGISESQVKKLQKRALEKLRTPKLRQWHSNNPALDGSFGTEGIFTFFPESSDNDDEQFNAMLAGLNVGDDDIFGTA